LSRDSAFGRGGRLRRGGKIGSTLQTRSSRVGFTYNLHADSEPDKASSKLPESMIHCSPACPTAGNGGNEFGRPQIGRVPAHRGSSSTRGTSQPRPSLEASERHDDRIDPRQPSTGGATGGVTRNQTGNIDADGVRGLYCNNLRRINSRNIQRNASGAIY